MKLSHGPVNVLECGATGDGVTDDTGAIQEAINWVCPRGGGKLFFPFTPTGYRIASLAAEAVEGRRCRSQLYKGPCHVDIGSIDFEPGFKHRPPVSTMQYGVWDPENRLRGSLRYHCGAPCGLDYFPVRGGARLLCSRTTPA